MHFLTNMIAKACTRAQQGENVQQSLTECNISSNKISTMTVVEHIGHQWG